jgi:hypothetical protein
LSRRGSAPIRCSPWHRIDAESRIIAEFANAAGYRGTHRKSLPGRLLHSTASSAVFSHRSELASIIPVTLLRQRESAHAYECGYAYGSIGNIQLADTSLRVIYVMIVDQGAGETTTMM